MCKKNNSICRFLNKPSKKSKHCRVKIICRDIGALRYNYINELNDFEEFRPTCHSFWIPFIALLVFVALLFVPLQCSSQTMCNCCNEKDTVTKDTLSSVPFSSEVAFMTEKTSYDTIILNKKSTVFQKQIPIQKNNQKNEIIPILIYRIVIAFILLLAIVLTLKQLVPYWTKITELNDKHRDKLIRLAEERLEFERLRDKNDINNNERKENFNLDEKSKDNETKRKIEVMKQEYQSHLADVSLEMVKAVNQSNEKDKSALVNQLLQILKK